MTGAIEMDQMTLNAENSTQELHHTLCFAAIYGLSLRQIHPENREEMADWPIGQMEKLFKANDRVEAQKASSFTFNQAFNAEKVTRLI